MSTARFIVGDVFDGLASLEDSSVDLVMSSPPFLALRSYLPADHPDKGKEIGSEPTPGAFIDTMLDVVEECARVLAPHGSLVFELGDTYAGSGGAGGDYNEGGLRENQPKFRQYSGGVTGYNTTHSDHRATRNAGGGGWPLDKSKTLIPQLFAIALAYGFNPLTGRTTDPWRVRNVVAWCRPNPPVGRDGDKFRPATSYLTVATKARDRYWDGDAVRTAAVDVGPRATNGTKVDGRDGEPRYDTRVGSNPAGAPLLDWWEIPTHGFKGAHYATYPAALVVPIVKSMCPLKVCRVCGEPSRRIVETFTLDSYRASTRPQTVKAVALADTHGLTDEHIAAIRAFGTSDAGKAIVLNGGAGKNTDDVKRLAGEAKAVLGGYFREFVMTTNVERSSGWSDCGHDDYRPGVVLDPFAGSGTTLAVATGHGLNAIGIDLDARNAELAYARIGMFLTVEHLAQEGAA